ncbi:MAG TPA: dTDP-4-dehydrorhamnose reductase [Flavobacteriaceae bacterium]|nr:dTDP-4-dehydrorhamnose reductase [Flavobacteriaceae bacterium]
MKNILVTGTNGQLGKCFQKEASNYSGFHFLYTTPEELDITSEENLNVYFDTHKIDVCINCAAYTNVEKAESEPEKAFAVNAEAVKILAEICKFHQVILFHFSTDYVFDGKKNEAYSEEDSPNPINVYGASKLKGEKYIQDILERYFIFRTSWLYSEFGHNFYKTILSKSEEAGVQLKITDQQTGTPTNANDLAKAVLKTISLENKNYGLYHYSNMGKTTWYGFAKAILDFTGKSNTVNLQASDAYKTVAKRPENSLLSKFKSTVQLQLNIPYWEESLKKLISESHAL